MRTVSGADSQSRGQTPEQGEMGVMEVRQTRRAVHSGVKEPSKNAFISQNNVLKHNLVHDAIHFKQSPSENCRSGLRLLFRTSYCKANVAAAA